MYKKYTSKGMRNQNVDAGFSNYKETSKNISLTDLWAWRKDFLL